MIKAGFICEGYTEQILLRSDEFQQFLTSINIISVNVINALGCGNLLPHNIKGFIQSLEKQKAEVIFILTDLDNDVCISKTKDWINARRKDIVIIAVKKIEAWFLANDNAMRLLLNDMDFSFPAPEAELNSFEKINDLLIQKTGRGVSKRSAGKIKLVNKLLDAGLQLSDSANHPNCSSPRYFINKLMQVGTAANS